MNIEIPNGITPTHIKDFSQALISQFKNPRNKEVNFEKAAKEASLPAHISPQELTQSEGFAFLAESIGLTDQFLLEALHEDILTKPQNRVKELKLAFDLKGKLVSNASGASANENTAKAMDILKQVLKKPEPKVIIQQDNG